MFCRFGAFVRQAFKIEPGADLSESSKKAITRLSLREVPQPISSKLQLDFPDASLDNLANQARRMEEVLSRTQTPTENVSTVTSAESTESKLEALRTGFKELNIFLQAQSAQDSAGKVHVVPSKHSPPTFQQPPPPPRPKLFNSTMLFMWIHRTLAKKL